MHVFYTYLCTIRNYLSFFINGKKKNKIAVIGKNRTFSTTVLLAFLPII